MKTSIVKVSVNKYVPYWKSTIWLVLVSACNTLPIAIDNISTAPPVVQSDEAYANVYQLLDGHWKGVFKIYEDMTPGERGENSLTDISVVHLRKPTLKLSSTIEVEQFYTSESPYFQRVVIKDTYKNAEGNKQIVESKGVNKIQNGKMWCVVKKPDETVIHEGILENEHTIIWQRNNQKPQKIEYFREMVKENVYEIIGYGYYENDDSKLMPKYWFYGRYEKQVEN